tara:strand:+ start:853 stop:1218 length:366 start_codon:yes stop_codon:yes gene_type:complete
MLFQNEAKPTKTLILHVGCVLVLTAFHRSQRNPLNPWLKEAEFHKQILEFLDAIRIEDDDIRDWFRAVLASKTWDSQAESRAMQAELQRQVTLLGDQQDRKRHPSLPTPAPAFNSPAVLGA